ncbi:hypothetical protein GE107_01015 [Cohnella sp. CFH 77786]|uniref:hypothetical protein n=1 Tax=Cohnella sp. CFH 77786 TaxID=2662265 RepID=UPI001C60C6B3|nr:hypothetical protein [Cohnella sp. CFH 77786]MBW5444646.1 hypothetical protein [Cohnella sp. CFH 77786]
MAVLSTGPVDNSPVSTERLLVKLVNRDAVNGATVLIQGYHLDGSRTLYVLEQFAIAPNAVITKNYFAAFAAYEFVFTTGGPAEASTEISVWGLNGNGEIVSAQRIVADEELGT